MNKDITLVVTACNRPDMLLHTLKTFFEMNPDCGIVRALITEDGGKQYDYSEIFDLVNKYVPDNKFFFNETNIGQIASIDQMYAEVNTPWIFHLEDDLEFYKPNFVKDSMTIFDNYDRLIGGPLFTVGGFKTTTERQMWVRPSRLESGDPMVIGGIECKLMRNSEFLNGRLNMGGFALTHGLRQTAFCRMFGPYSRIPSELKTQEWDIGVRYRNAGFRSIIPLGDGYCQIQPNTDHRSCYHTGYEWRWIDIARD
jgi:hypothetical protein